MTITKLATPPLCLLGSLLLACQQPVQQQEEVVQEQTLVISNPSSLELKEKAVAVQRSALGDSIANGIYPLLQTAAGDTLAAQLDDLDGDGKWDELFFLADLPAQGKEELRLRWLSSPVSFPTRTSIRFGKRPSAQEPVQPKTTDTLFAYQLPKSIGYQPYQTDGPSWENDMVGFRHYFDGRNAKDLFGKKTSAITPETVGIDANGAVEDNYHVMADWGRDILAVGNSAGLGGIALEANGKLYRLGVTVDDSIHNIEKSVFNIVTEGPVRSVLDLHYLNWQANGRSYQLKERSSIWPGMYAFENELSLQGLQGDENLLVGLVNSRTDQGLQELMVNDQWVVLLTHDKQTYEKEWWLGLALILPRDAYQGYLEAPKIGPLSTSYFGRLKVANDKPLRYYVVAGWELSDERFRDRSFFESYVKDLARQLSTQVGVAVR